MRAQGRSGLEHGGFGACGPWRAFGRARLVSFGPLCMRALGHERHGACGLWGMRAWSMQASEHAGSWAYGPLGRHAGVGICVPEGLWSVAYTGLEGCGNFSAVRIANRAKTGCVGLLTNCRHIGLNKSSFCLVRPCEISFLARRNPVVARFASCLWHGRVGVGHAFWTLTISKPGLFTHCHFRTNIIPLVYGQLLEPPAPRLVLAYGEVSLVAPLSGHLLEPSAPRMALSCGELEPFSALAQSSSSAATPLLALTYGGLNTSAPLNTQLLALRQLLGVFIA